MLKTIHFPIHDGNEGKLIAIEENIHIPFDIKRIYYIYDCQNDVVRGRHAHKTLQQVYICLSGSFLLILDNGIERQEILMNNQAQGVLFDKLIWREIHHFTPDAVLLVLANELYNEDDYIRSYEDFLAYAKEVRNENTLL